MKQQRVMQIDWVRERYVREAGATSSLRDYRVGYAALVTPASTSAQVKSRPNQVQDSIAARTESGPELVPDLDQSEYRIRIESVPVQDLNRYLSWTELRPSIGRNRGQRGNNDE